jgi:hypothetical protein
MKPIIFRTDGIRAILDGRKTQTRRIIKPLIPSEYWLKGLNEVFTSLDNKAYFTFERKKDPGFIQVKCPYGKVGDVMWVRETWKIPHSMDDLKPSCCGDYTPVKYLADDYVRYPGNATDKTFGKIRPSIYMPKNVARIFLEITNIRVERVQEISEKDAYAEGIYNGEPCLCDVFVRCWRWSKVLYFVRKPAG